MEKLRVFAFADEASPAISGQIAAMGKKEQPAAEIISEMFGQAEQILLGATKWVK